MMETVADYGVVDYFGVATFTSGVFRTWFALGDRVTATQLAGWLFVVVAVLVLAEHYGRRGQFANPLRRAGRRAAQASQPVRGASWRALLAPCRSCWVSCCRPLFLAATPYRKAIPFGGAGSATSWPRVSALPAPPPSSPPCWRLASPTARA